MKELQELINYHDHKMLKLKGEQNETTYRIFVNLFNHPRSFFK